MAAGATKYQRLRAAGKCVTCYKRSRKTARCVECRAVEVVASRAKAAALFAARICRRCGGPRDTVCVLCSECRTRDNEKRKGRGQ